MPTPDPNQEMEELLRAYARQRRQDAGAPFELSPDARERLQDEVRRALRPSNVAPIPRRGISLAGWLRLALGGAVAAVLVAVLHHYTPSAASNPKTAKAPTWVSNLRALSPSNTPPDSNSRIARAPTWSANFDESPSSNEHAASNLQFATAPTWANNGGTITAPSAPAAPPAASSQSAIRNPQSAMEQSAPAAAAMPAPPVVTLAPPDTNKRLAMERPRLLDNSGADSMDEKLRAATNPPSVGGLAASAPTGHANDQLAGGAALVQRDGMSPGELASAPARPAAGGARGGRGGGAPGGGGGGAGGGGFGGGLAAVPAATPDSQSAIRNPQSAIRSLQSPAPSFAQQMARSDLPGLSNARVQTRGPAPSQVLASFQIERIGQQVRIVDTDGSTYQGQVIEGAQMKGVAGNIAAAGSASAKDAPQNSPASVAAEAPGSPPLQLAGVVSSFTFQAGGLNRTLNQDVTITGNCVNVPFLMGATSNGVNLSIQNQSQSGVNAIQNSLASPASPQSGQSLGMTSQNNAINYANSQNMQINRNTQNVQTPLLTGQIWRVTGQVQVGPSNRFDLDAATLQP